MSECNCCCAYLSPPWWVTMGYTPPARLQGQSSQPTQSIPAASNTSTSGQTPGPTSRGTIVGPPPARLQATSVRPAGPRPTAAGVITSTIGDMVQLL
jgi:hypothetical protein